MPCYSGAENIAACKIISLYEDNKKHNLPTIIVHVLLFQDGKLVSIMVNVYYGKILKLLPNKKRLWYIFKSLKLW